MPTRGASTSEAPGYDVVPVTKSDTTPDPNGPFRGFYITAAGTLKITTAAGNARTFASGELAAGVLHPIRITRVWSTGTAATVWGVV
jgi:hypothetical protein